MLWRQFFNADSSIAIKNVNRIKEKFKKMDRLIIEKNYYKNNFKKDISENIKEFKELGLELTVGWVRSNE